MLHAAFTWLRFPARLILPYKNPFLNHKSLRNHFLQSASLFLEAHNRYGKIDVKMEEDEDGRVDDPNESPSKAPAPQHPPGNPLASGAAQHPAVRACDAKFMSYVDHFNKANPGFQSTAAPSEGSWTFNPQPIGPSQQQTAPLPSPAAQPTVISAIAAPAREQIVIPRNWTPSHQRIYTVSLT